MMWVSFNPVSHINLIQKTMIIQRLLKHHKASCSTCYTDEKTTQKSSCYFNIYSHDFWSVKELKKKKIPIYKKNQWCKDWYFHQRSDVLLLTSGCFEMNNQAAWWALAKWLKHSNKHSNGMPGLASDYYQLPSIKLHNKTPKQCPNWTNEHFFFFCIGTATEFKSGA